MSKAAKQVSWGIVPGLFVLSLLLRAAHLYAIHDEPLFRYLFLDPLYYDEWGRRIAAGDWLGDSIFFQDPAYPYFLGIVYAVFGHRLLVVAAIQVLLGSLLAPMLYLSARSWLGERAAWIAGLIAALYLPSVYYEGMILKTWMGVLLVAAAFWALSVSIRSGQGRPWLVTGVLLGLACLARGNVLLFLPVLAIWILLDPDSTGTGRSTSGRSPGGPAAGLADRRRWTAAVCLLVGAALLLGVSATRNRIVGGWWVLTTANAGQNFYIGNNPLNTSGEYAVLPFVDSNPKHEERDFAREAERRTGGPMEPREISGFWFGQARDWIRSNPGDWLGLMFKKTRNYFGAYEIPDNLDYYLYREFSPVLRLPLPGFGLVAPLGLLGAILALSRGAWPRLLLLFLATYSASVLLFFVFSRFRMAAMPALFVFAGYAVSRLIDDVGEAIRQSRIGRGPLVRLALLLALLAFVNLPVRGPAGLWSVGLAEKAGLPVRTETTATGRYNLGLAFAIQAKDAAEPGELLRMAESELRQSLRQDATHAKVHVELGKVLARMERNREAIESYRRALAIEPGDWRTHLSLGVLHRREGDTVAAEDALRTAASLEPRSATAHIQLGETLLALGRSGEAAGSFEAALRLSPGLERARRGLEEARRAQGRTP